VPQQREIASGMLKKLGYNVLSVPSGEEAIVYLKENKADLLVLDMIMRPGIDGLETYKKILQYHPEQKAVIASGYSESQQVKAAQNMGAGIYVKKPYSFEKIGLAVKGELSK
jgi:CheY-like chemotaxis protein